MFLKKKVRHPNGSPYHSVKGGLPTPGVENIGFARPTTLPMITIEGQGTRTGALALLQPPQVYVNLALPIAGLGGQQNGQFISAPLVNTDLSPLD